MSIFQFVIKTDAAALIASFGVEKDRDNRLAQAIAAGKVVRIVEPGDVPAGAPLSALLWTDTGPLGVDSTVTAALTAKVSMALVRAYRQKLMGLTDKVRMQIARQEAGAVPAKPIDGPTATAWIVWTQALADLPEAYAAPAAVVWPAPPASPALSWPAFPAGIGTEAAGWVDLRAAS